MAIATKLVLRIFKTARFGRDAMKTGISDSDLCSATAQVIAGQADDLGGGVFKKRLNSKDEDLLEICNGDKENIQK